MYIPVDPNKLNNFWDKFKRSLKNQRLAFVINNYQYDNNIKLCVADFDEINKLIARYKLAEYVRIGSKHLHPAPCHFAIDFTSCSTGIIKELISANNSLDQIKNDISLIIQFIFLELPILKELLIPFPVFVEVDSEFKVEVDNIKNQTRVLRL